MGEGVRFLVSAVLLLSPLALARHDDDFAFDNGEEFQVELAANHSEIARNSLRRLWGVPDTAAYVGHLFRMEIPKEAFSGEVVAYKVRGPGDRRAPNWLAVDSKHGLVTGVPMERDLGSHVLTVTAHGRTPGLSASDSFTILVKGAQEKPQTQSCKPNESRMGLVIILDVHYNRLQVKQKIRALMELGKFMALSGDAFSMEPYKSRLPDDVNYAVLVSGPGSSQRRRSDGSTAINLRVGCGGKLWPRHKVLVAGIREQARDGTLAALMKLPVLGWRLASERPPRPPADITRNKRQSKVTEGSGSYNDYDDGEGDYGDDYSGDGGDDEDYADNADPLPINPEPTTDAQDQTAKEVQIVPYSANGMDRAPNAAVTSKPRKLDVSPVIIVPEAPTTVTEATQERLSSTDRTSTIFGQTTETIEFDVRAPSNQPPVQQNPIQKLTAIAGKAFRYIIPEDVFFDPEDGKNLSLRMYDSNMVELKPTSWVQLLPKSREVYGLPLEEHVSIWYYKVQARDSQGATVRGKLDIKVNEHKGKRTVNHEFVLTLKLNQTYAKPVNWQIRVLEGLVNVFSDSDMDNITVRSVVQRDDLIDFTWTNDSLPRDVCPTSQIERLMAVMEIPGSKGEPSPRLTAMMSPQIRPVAVRWRGLGVCAPATDPPPVPAPAQTPPQVRNQVDHVEAVAGHLLVYKVPEDTFFDPEDGPTRKLHLSLVGGDYSPLESSHWMQFDTKNQEFYGLPTEGDVGRRDYQLIAEDPTGKTAFDSLEVVVKSAAEYNPTVEFQMTLEDMPGRLSDAKDKRKLVEKIAELFGDKDTSSIRMRSITYNPITIVWHNTSLTSTACPHEQIQALKKIIIHEEKDGRQEMLTEHVDEIFDSNFKVMSMRLIPLGLCSDAESGIKSVQAGDRGHQGGHENRGAITFDDYLITYIIPVVVIVCMVLIASVIACVLYRRRKTGKMSVGDEEERQAFRSKGIPVIFQDELDDKPEPSHKSPVIMQEEKPPLLPPPEYRQGESATHSPYRPPPPFTTSRDSSRPKPAPSYRKPPPYVPP